MASFSLLALFVLVLFFVPVAIFKIGYEKKVPLIKHDFSLPLELRQFYLSVVSIMVIAGFVFGFFSEFDAALADKIFFSSPSIQASVKDFCTLPNFLYFIVTYGLCFLFGVLSGHWKIVEIRKHLENGNPLFELKDISLFGLWTAIIFSKKGTLTLSLDILTDGDLLYSGDLYHYEKTEGNLSTITLKNTKRFLVPIDKVKGNDEKKYLIPGEFTYFFISKIKNINIRAIVEEKDKLVFWGETVIGELAKSKKFKEELEKIMNELSQPPPPLKSEAFVEKKPPQQFKKNLKNKKSN